MIYVLFFGYLFIIMLQEFQECEIGDDILLFQEEDRLLLEKLSQQEAEDAALHTERREKAQADATWMKKVRFMSLGYGN